MKSLKNYEKNFEILGTKKKFRNYKQNYLRKKTLRKDYFIDISDIKDNEISLNKNYKNLIKEEKFITIEEQISLEEEEGNENNNNMYMILSYNKCSNDLNDEKENKEPNILQLQKEKEKESKKILHLNIQEDKDTSLNSNNLEIEYDLEQEKKIFELRKEVINIINNLSDEEVVDLLVFLENIRPQAIEELPNDTIYINIEQFNDDTFIKVFDYLTDVNIID
jgi:hypothetical protein